MKNPEPQHLQAIRYTLWALLFTDSIHIDTQCRHFDTHLSGLCIKVPALGGLLGREQVNPYAEDGEEEEEQNHPDTVPASAQ